MPGVMKKEEEEERGRRIRGGREGTTKTWLEIPVSFAPSISPIPFPSFSPIHKASPSPRRHTLLPLYFI